MRPQPLNFVFASAVLLGFASVAIAHSNDEGMSMDISDAPARPTSTSVPETYFRYSEHVGLMMAHIFLMVIAWVFILPIGKNPELSNMKNCN